MTERWEPDADLGFDALDSVLGEQLRASAPSAPDASATLAGLRPGMLRARRRHRMVVGGASALAMVALVTLAVVALRPGGGADVETPPATRSEVSTTSGPTSTSTPTTLPVVPDTTPTTATPGSTPGTTPGTVDDHGGGSGNSGPGGGSGSGSSGSGSGSSGSGSGSSGSGSSGSGSSGSGSSGSGSSGSG